MKFVTLLLGLLGILTACKKEATLPTLSFSTEDRKWFIYQIGQTIKLKNASGDSVVYTVTSVRNDFKSEYIDPLTNPVKIGTTEFYQVDLNGPTDSIFLYFYKEFQYSSNSNKMKQTIRWNSMLGQFAELEAIQTQSSFIIKTINGVTYNKVTQATPSSQTSYPWTKWKVAYYDQSSGLIELIDINGGSWLRQ
ncbi:MAG TPA: hypothetical protein VKB95_04595 [Chitinophagaceae bacterium]|nr:hypothetical protein [Chitinophagaceae bacterium]